MGRPAERPQVTIQLGRPPSPGPPPALDTLSLSQSALNGSPVSLSGVPDQKCPPGFFLLNTHTETHNVHAYIRTHTQRLRTWTHTYGRTHTHRHTMCMHTHTCTHIHMYIYMYTHTLLFMHSVCVCVFYDLQREIYISRTAI